MTSRTHPYTKLVYRKYSAVNNFHDASNTSDPESSEKAQTERFPSISAAVRYPYSPCWPAPYAEGVFPGVT